MSPAETTQMKILYKNVCHKICILIFSNAKNEISRSNQEDISSYILIHCQKVECFTQIFDIFLWGESFFFHCYEITCHIYYMYMYIRDIWVKLQNHESADLVWCVCVYWMNGREILWKWLHLFHIRYDIDILVATFWEKVVFFFKVQVLKCIASDAWFLNVLNIFIFEGVY